jgi:pyrrolidone-carboxylate peptidase
MTSQNDTTADLLHDAHGVIDDVIEDLRTSDVVINEVHKVRLPKHIITGAEIKQAAIEQGVPIQPDFLLTLERAGGREKQIGDTEKILTVDGMRFTAIAGDDNS